MLRDKLRCARWAALARWLSMVTSTTRMEAASPPATETPSTAEVRFCIVQSLDGDDRNPLLLRISFGVAAGLAAHKEGDFFEDFLQLHQQAHAFLVHMQDRYGLSLI